MHAEQGDCGAGEKEEGDRSGRCLLGTEEEEQRRGQKESGFEEEKGWLVALILWL